MTTEELLEQELRLQFDTFCSDDALNLGLAIIDIAKKEYPKGIAVHIELDTYPLFTHYMEGTSENNTYWLRTKKNTVIRFAHSSLYTGISFKERGTGFKESSGLSSDEYQAEGGAFPLVIKGKGRVGTITVSGLTGEEDHALAVKGIERFLAGR